MIGLSILSGSHRELIPDVLAALGERADIPVVVGGIIPEADAEALKAAGVAAVYTPEGLRDHAHPARDRGARRRRATGSAPPRDCRSCRRGTLGALNRDRGAELGARLRERDLTAAPAALNLLENRTLRRGGGGAAGRGGAGAARRRGGRTRGGVTGPAGSGQVDAAVGSGARLAGRRADGRGAGGGSDLEALGRRAARRSRADRGRPGRPRAVHPLDGRGRAARRPRSRHAGGRAGAGGGLRRRGDRDGRGRPVGDRGGGGGRHASPSSFSRARATSCSSSRPGSWRCRTCWW